MPTYEVYGTCRIGITFTVEADDADSAIEVAYETWTGLSNYVGNGGTDKLVGTTDRDVSLDGDGAEPEFTEAEEVE